MATIFSWTPDAGNTGWDNPVGFVTNYLDDIGCVGGAALTCAPPQGSFNGTGGLSKQLDTVFTPYDPCYGGPWNVTPYRNMTIRLQWGYFNHEPELPFQSICNFNNNTIYSSKSDHFDGVFGVNPVTGSVRIIITSAGLDVSSAAGVLPGDGFPHGIQLALAFTGFNQVSYQLVIDNGTAIAGTATHLTIPGPYPCLSYWGSSSACNPPDPCAAYQLYSGISEMDVLFFRYPSSDAYCAGPATAMSVLGPVTVEDIVNIIDYPPCAGATAITPTICCPPAAVSNMSIGCDTQRITVLGTNFQAGATISLEGPTGASVPFTVVSFSLTQIVLQLSSFVSGTYCVTVTNP